jgi:hypothetical protein
MTIEIKHIEVVLEILNARISVIEHILVENSGEDVKQKLTELFKKEITKAKTNEHG